MALWVTMAQIGWFATIFLHTPVPVTLVIVVTLWIVEGSGPFLAETRLGGTPWHAHHIVERYGLITIIALGEGVVGTVASLSAVVGEQGWSVEAVFVGVAGTGLTFGMWWTYFVLPQADILHARRDGPSGSVTSTCWFSPRSWRPARGCMLRRTTSSSIRSSDRCKQCSLSSSPWGCTS